MSELQHFFRTKTGVCTITPEQIVLSRTGLRGVAAGAVVGTSLTRVLTIYVLFAGMNLLFGGYLLVEGIRLTRLGQSLGVMFCMYGGLSFLVCAYVLRAVFKSRSCSATPSIERSTIRSIEAHPPVPPLKRGYFLVHFDDQGQPRRRIIILPGCLAGGAAEYQRAVAELREAGLLDREPRSDTN